MILADISIVCDSCKEVGQCRQACRWIPGENLGKPDLPKSWQLIFEEATGWVSYCVNCKMERK